MIKLVLSIRQNRNYNIEFEFLYYGTGFYNKISAHHQIKWHHLPVFLP